MASWSHALLVATVWLIPSSAYAWKPTTHVYLAEIAADDALDDGFVTVPLLRDEQVLQYPVSEETLEALRLARPQYRAGLLGPDAYPDILTGQQVIHPEGAETGVPSGSDAWLAHVWVNFSGSPQERAFRLGFLTHAAGDSYGHTFVNYFTGGPFTIVPPENALKHIVLEGYIDKRLPADALTGDFFNASIDSLERRIYSAMIDARPGNVLDAALLPRGSSSTDLSIPRIFSTLRANLEADITGYYNRKRDLENRINDCDLLDFSCSKVLLGLELAGYVALNGLQTTYKEYWRSDVDDGLRAWPTTSHGVALALFFNPSRSADTERADEILSQYALRHLLSMAGAPDAVGLGIDAVQDIIAAITPDFLLEPIRQLKEDTLNSLLKSAIGMTKDELKDYLTQPDRYFDQVMAVGAGKHISLAEFNRDYLRIADIGYDDPSQSFDYEDLAATYNTVLLSKLILLEPAQINELIADLGGTATLSTPNIMLGFASTLDGSLQWRSGMILAAECKVYERIFKKLPNEGTCQDVPGTDEVAAVPAVFFESAKALVETNEVNRFDLLARDLLMALSENPRARFAIEGHADAIGSEAYNLGLSKRRAEAVASLLTKYYQIPAESLAVDWFGETRLKVPTQEASRENRRVEFLRLDE